MRIYHYTNLEALALILRNKTIRFNCLDNVDDIEEGNSESYGVRFCKYLLVSCWTENSEETIPLWKMYGGDFGGVRISMEQDMFEEYVISDLRIGNMKSHGGIKTKIPQQDMMNPNFFILPFLHYDNDMFYRKIKYVDDVFQYTKDAIQITNIKDERGDVHMDMKPFGYYKNKRWEFQKESRFVLYTFPFNPLLEGEKPDLSSIAVQSLLSNKPLSISHYDMCLKNDAIDNMEITLSPSTNEAQKIIIQSIVEKYAPLAKINDSTLGSVVRLK